MKFFLYFIISLGFSLPAYSQDKIEKFEIRTAPLAILARWLTLDLSFRLADNYSAGPSTIIYYSPKIGNMFTPSYNGFAVGGHAYYYFNTYLNNSWYLGSHAYYEKYESYPHAAGVHYELSGTKLTGKLGYQIRSETNFTFLIGAGLEARSYSKVVILDAPLYVEEDWNASGYFPYFEFKTGYSF